MTPRSIASRLSHSAANGMISRLTKSAARSRTAACSGDNDMSMALN